MGHAVDLHKLQTKTEAVNRLFERLSVKPDDKVQVSDINTIDAAIANCESEAQSILQQL